VEFTRNAGAFEAAFFLAKNLFAGGWVLIVASEIVSDSPGQGLKTCSFVCHVRSSMGWFALRLLVLCEILGGYCIVEAGGVLDESGPICTILLPFWEPKA
jgi:hypothetical protein